MEEERADCGGVAESDFGFGWVHIDVDQRRIEVEHQNEAGLTIPVQGFPKRLTDRKAERSVAYAPSIDKEKLVVCAWTGGFWQSEHAPQGQT
jgi:hypothetical protein